AAAGEWDGLIKHGAHARHDSLTAYLVVRTCADGAAVLRDGIRAIECIVEAAPARVCGIQRISRVGERHDKLGPGIYRDLVIDISGADVKIVLFGQNIADVTQKPLVVAQIKWLAGALTMILIDAGLELDANLEQLAIAPAALAQQLCKAAPERFSRDARSRRCLLLDELMQGFGNAQAADPDVIHVFPVLAAMPTRFCNDHETSELFRLGSIILYYCMAETPACSVNAQAQTCVPRTARRANL